MSTVGTRERRQLIRKESDGLPVVVQRLGKTALALEPSLFDISERGMGFQMAEPLQPGERLQFRIMLPAGPIAGVGSVRWTKPHHLGHRCGILIEKINWSNSRKLYYFLRPNEEDPIRVLDKALMAGFLLVGVLLAMDFVGLSFDKIFLFLRWMGF